MSFLNENLNKPKLNGIKLNGMKKPVIKSPKLEPKKEEKPVEVASNIVKEEEINSLKFEPTPEVEEKEEIVEEQNIEEEQATFEEFKTLDEVNEPKEEKIEEESTIKEIKEEVSEETENSTDKEVDKETIKNEEPVKNDEVEEEKPKKKTRKKTTKAKKEEKVVDESDTDTVIEDGSSDLSLMEKALTEIINPTIPAWEEEKAIVNSKMDEITIDADMGSAEMDEMLSKLSHLENDVRQRLDDVTPEYINLKELVDYVESTAGKGTNVSEKKAAGKIACTRYVQTPGGTPMNLYIYLRYTRARYDFYKSKMEQIKNENGRLITLSAVRKLECSLAR